MMKQTVSLGLAGLLWVLLSLPLPAAAAASEVIIRSDSQFAFARQYLERGEYAEAAAEFERFRYFFPDDPRADEARYLTGFCLLRQERFDAARERFGALVASDPDSRLSAKAFFMTGESYYEEGRMEAARAVFEEVVKRYPDLEIKNAALYRMGWTDLRMDAWEHASALFGRVAPESAFYQRAQTLVRESLEGASLPLKSPGAAGVLAGLLPGAGHAYVGRWKDGAVAFVLNAVFIWAAVEAFDNDQEVLGGILTFLEVGWYSGNIYSAVNVAHKHNRKIKDEFRQRLDERLDLRLFTGRRGDVGLAFGWRF